VSESGRRTEVKVGLFVLFGIAALTAVLLLLGEKKHVFQHRVKVHSVFPDVAGLVVGAPVQIAGVNVGTVSHVEFDRSQMRPRIRVDFEITQESLDLLHADSIARIASQGLLGDKLIDISPGSIDEAPILAGGRLRSTTPTDLDQLVEQAGQVMKKLDRVAAGAALLADELSSESTRANIHGALEGLHSLLDAATQWAGPGARAVLRSQNRRRCDRPRPRHGSVDRTRQRHGGGDIEPILQSTDKQGKQVVNNLSRAAENVSKVAAQLDQSQLVPAPAARRRRSGAAHRSAASRRRHAGRAAPGSDRLRPAGHHPGRHRPLADPARAGALRHLQRRKQRSAPRHRAAPGRARANADPD